jgi:Fe2+ or Zn2+ uptake regulation protein
MHLINGKYLIYNYIMDRKVTQAIKYLDDFLGLRGKSQPETAEELHPRNAPLWTKEAAHLYRIPLQGSEVILVALEPEVRFEQALNLYRALSKLELGPILLLVDSLPSKVRGVLVRMKIPHLVSTGAIYAPQLGMAYSKVAASQESDHQEVKEKLMPIAQKLVVARLLKVNFMERFPTLTELHSLLKKEKHAVSVTTLSRAFRQLEHFGLVQVEGSGPRKKVKFINPELLWAKLVEVETETVLKRSARSQLPPQKIPWVYSSDSALSRLSDLNAPAKPAIAISLAEFKHWQRTKKPDGSMSNDSDGVNVEIWREDPTFLSRKQCLNPIELCLSLRRSRDPRIQLALSEILKREGLNANLLWERE